jgi:ABC-type multidrug transport system ATPase subunit
MARKEGKAIDSKPMFKLILKDGAKAGQEFELSNPEIVVGRESGVDILLSTPAVSRRHARLIRQGDSYAIEDLGSSNGTFVNGQKIDITTALKSGDKIRFGQAVELTFEGPPPQEKPQPSAVAETLIGEEPLLPDLEGPARLVITISGDNPQTQILEKPKISIGRADDNDITISSKIVSRYHAVLNKVGDDYQIEVLPVATNPVYVNGRPITEPRILQSGEILRIGGLDPGMMVSLVYEVPGEVVASPPEPIIFAEKTSIQIGRDPENDVVLDAPTVSRFHAQVERIGTRFRLQDLRSANGTFVNDQRVEGDTWLQSDETIRIGPYRFVVGQNQLTQYSDIQGLRVDMFGLNKWVRKDLNILQDISLSFQPREFVVVVGQSGGGKSTLVDAIAGYRPATDGRVIVNGVDIYRNFDAIRSEIGYVPQRDIIHMELTVYQALDYAARLRMPTDTTKEERHQRIMEVLEDLDLTHRRDVQISGLSGGQQKRVSIGVELLTKPGLFYLDEPTSGLDPGTETALMQLMRQLADQGRTIVLITHATKNVMLADKVIFLSRGGFLAWFGPPEEALQYFDQYRSERERRSGQIEFDEIYAILDDPSRGTAEDWAQRYKKHAAFQKYIVQPLEYERKLLESMTPDPTTSKTKSKRTASSFHQFLIFSSRNLKILTRDRFSLILMLVAAPLVGLLDVVLSFAIGSDPYNPVTGNMADVITTIFILTVYGVLVGALSQMREFVKERDIYKRERLVNLKILPYVLSKVWVAVILAFYQAGAYLIVRYLAFEVPGGAAEIIMVYITLVLATTAGMMLGLFASALSPNANAAPLFVILLILPQMILNGALIPVPQYISAPTSTHWAFKALMGITGVTSDVAGDICWSLPEEARKAMTIEDKETNNCQCMGVSVLDPESCSFPGIGKFYNAAIDEPSPDEPPPLGNPPPEPVLPERPVQPEDQSDSIAMAEFFDELEVWEAEVQEIQAGYKQEVDAYQADADVFKAESIAYQESLAEWNIARASAVEPAENTINQFRDVVGWSFMDKSDEAIFRYKIFETWFAMLVIISIFIAGILILQRVRDGR